MSDDMPIKYIRRESTEYVGDTVTADVDLDTQPVAMAVIPWRQVGVDEGDWHPVEWLGDVDTSRDIQLLVGPDGDVDLDRGDYLVLRRIVDATEKPVNAICLLRIL